MTEPETNPLQGKSDDELLAMEQDTGLPMDQWQAVEAERERRGARDPQPRREPPIASPQRDPAPPAHASGSPAARPLGDDAEDAQVQAALAQIRALLVPGETLLAYAVQRRLFALTHRRLLLSG